MSDRHTAGPTESEKDAFFAQIAADEKRKLDAHDDLVKALKLTAAVCAGENCTKSGLIEALEAARDALRKATGEQQ